MTDAEIARIRSHISASTFCSHDEIALMGEVERLTAQLKIADDALEHIVQCADRGLAGSLLGVYAHDALIQMSVVE